MSVPPGICIVGSSGTGKTTFLEKLIGELERRGFRVGTIKHHHGDFEMDKPGKDTWRHARAGARSVCISSPRKFALIRQVEEELSLQEIVPLLGPVDIVLAEGYKKGDWPQIEVCPPGETAARVGRKDRLIALVGDGTAQDELPCFGREDVGMVADFIVDFLGLN
ncbi:MULTISPECIES: molybdopterin-guanine dinucleotide biosynthesis protein B [Desulfofundulus]|jgi:molybdopterin-guanine dinucleotide biosynthesis protein B|uniref:Molybdopterin guanine dinucleotide biosynthesis accessory protein MobB n=1 Tax=Desulfofundulus australicus DSM 11792 TaxID=1121425 RepID=A0A1M4T2R7_9FIRM|nr:MULTISPECIES: molybdopterin-guanine dinucleotide biosynthesis protein B [Desulfofundulus]MBE3585507.1 molybdopterin-guanine dinucleotide biosynthesis protein B [Thermoanaerobacter sp.]MCS5696223.1 molybdopterin-guanine dinucleotide biosynthesis protein B [Desulfofundulus thermocisternus]MDK2888018.1 molybdopterin-guanine dinucleotide biosynthesis adapter protein [Thermoanaerobacter sp.]SHE38735.1 molybdopterin guanine dinucleotide biosynthesis accessory protein MobB [Desulfofundulus australi